MTTKGNINTLWYQHNAHGANSMISLKNRLPRADTLAINQHTKISVQLLSDGLVVFGMLTYDLMIII